MDGPPPEPAVSGRAIGSDADDAAPARRRPNRTGLPDRLKAGVESLSGVSLDEVRVRYNSPLPPRIGALAYARGTEIHVARGQEAHLPHEAWHLVQQTQGRVKPTMRLEGGVPINEDDRLEHEADVMGGQAASHSAAAATLPLTPATTAVSAPVQRKTPRWKKALIGAGLVGGAGLAVVAAGFGAPLLAAGGAALALGSGYAAYRTRAEDRAEEKRGLDDSFQELHEREQQLLRRLRDLPSKSDKREKIEKKLDDVNNSRRELIARTLEGGHDLWLPDSVPGEDRATAQALWSSISRNKGNIKVDRSDPEFHVNALADISKLLQSTHARKMLRRLNAPQPGGDARSIDIFPTKQPTENAPKGSPDDGHTGEGSKVFINYGEKRGHSIGEQDEPIHEPTYIKLGHELGHAWHYLAGTASSSSEVEAAQGDPVTRRLWTSQEEYNNITREENPIRLELELASRKYHVDFEDAPLLREIIPIIDKLQARYRELDLAEDYGKPQEDAELPLDEKWWLEEERKHDLDSAAKQAWDAMERLAKVAPRKGDAKGK